MAQMQALLEVMRMCTWPTSRLLRSVRRAACGVRLACRCRVLSLIRFSLSLSVSVSLFSRTRACAPPHPPPPCMPCLRLLATLRTCRACSAPRSSASTCASPSPASRSTPTTRWVWVRRSCCALRGGRDQNHQLDHGAISAGLFIRHPHSNHACLLFESHCLSPTLPRLPVSRNASRTAPTGTSRLSTSSRGPRTPTYPSITTTTTSSSSTAAAALFPPRPLSRTNADPPLSSGLCCCAVVFRRDVIRYVASTRQNVGAGMM